MKNYIALALIALTIITAHAYAQDPSHATEFRKPTPGPGTNGASNPTFLVHRLGNDHAEGIATLDMNGDGFPDILSGAYWYENPGAQGGDWKQHQFRTVEHPRRVRLRLRRVDYRRQPRRLSRPRHRRLDFQRHLVV